MIRVPLEIEISFSPFEAETSSSSQSLQDRIAQAADGFGAHSGFTTDGRRTNPLLRHRAGREDRGRAWEPGAGTPGTQGESGVPYSPTSLTQAMGITKEQYDAYREGVTDIEGKAYGHMGGAGGRYAGRYQLGPAEITETARRLGVPRPDTAEFLSNKEEQERFFENYTLEHYQELSRNPTFRSLSRERQLEMLGYAHNQGVGGALNYLNTGHAGSDAWGTSGTSYFSPIRRRYLDAAAKTGSESATKVSAPSPQPTENQKQNGI